MAEHGGQRTPAHPAAVSGPGSLSQRTDGGPTQAPMLASGGAYGDRTDMADIQSGAPLEGGGGGMSAAMLPKLTDPSARPDEPVTAGAALGAGVGPLAAGIGSDQSITNDQLRPLLSGLRVAANSPSSTAEFRTFVRNLEARLSDG